MADIKTEGNKVWVTALITVNLGNYESAKLEMGYSKDYTPKEYALEMADEMAVELENTLQQHVAKLRKLTKKKRRLE
jgi:hypothetical protein